MHAQPVPANIPDPAILADEKDRDKREKLPEIMQALAIKPGSVVADIGTGYGYYAVRLSPAVGLLGQVYAEEIDSALIDKLRRRIKRQKLPNIQLVLGSPDDPHLPESHFDAVLLADVYHEVENPGAMLRKIKSALKPGGRLMIIEYLLPDLRSATRGRQRKNHNIAPAFVEQDVRDAGFTIIERRDPLGPGYDGVPTYYVLAANP